MLRRPPRRSTRSLPGSVEAQAYYRRTEHRGNPAKVISSARTRIGDPPASGCRCSAGLRHARGDRRRDGVEMTAPQERLAVFQLLAVVTARRWKVLPGAKEFDIALARNRSCDDCGR